MRNFEPAYSTFHSFIKYISIIRIIETSYMQIFNWSGFPRPETPLFDCGQEFLLAGREGMATGGAYRQTSQ